MNRPLDQLREFGFERVLRMARRWSLLIVAGAAIAGLTSFAVSKTTPKEYQAEAQLYIAPASNPTVSFQDAVLGTNVARSYVQLVTAEVVLRPAMEQVGLADLRFFTEHTRASQLRDTSIILLTYRDTDPERAAGATNAIAASFISRSRELQTTLQSSTLTQLEAQIQSVDDDIKTLDSQISNLRVAIASTPRPGSPTTSRTDLQTELVQLDGTRQTKQQTLAQLLKTRNDMSLAAVRAESTVSLWQPAVVPIRAVTPQVALNTILGAFTGGFVTLIAVLVIAYIDDRITDPDDVAARLGIPALGQVHLGDSPETIRGKLFVRDSPRSPEAEAFRGLRTNIQFVNVDQRPRSLLITSALPREGKSVISANLALAFAQAGAPTILVDADLRRPSQHRIFGTSASVGLTSLLTDAVTLTQFTQMPTFTVAPNLYVIPSGPLPPNPSELLASTKMSGLIGQILRMHPDATLILDTSPVLAAADAAVLATKVDGTIFVVDAANTRAMASRQAVEALRRVRASVIGAVLNKISSEQGKYYYYYGYYGAGARPKATPAVTVDRGAQVRSR